MSTLCVAVCDEANEKLLLVEKERLPPKLSQFNVNYKVAYGCLAESYHDYLHQSSGHPLNQTKVASLRTLAFKSKYTPKSKRRQFFPGLQIALLIGFKHCRGHRTSDRVCCSIKKVYF